jgi:hypothetical protein
MTSGLKPELRNEILKHSYISLREIKDAALKSEVMIKKNQSNQTPMQQ